MSRRRFLIGALLAGALGHAADCVGPPAHHGPTLVMAQPKAPLPGAAQPILPRPAPARVPDPRGRQADADSVFFPVQRATARKLQQAEALIAEGRYGDAVLFLDTILGDQEDWFYRREGGAASYGSLKLEAERLIAQLPAQGREIYELQFGSRARKMLQQAVATANLAAVAEVSRRYFHTQAGGEATMLVGYSHLDHGRPLAAALCFEQLVDRADAARSLEPTLSVLTADSWRRAGKDARARRTLYALKSRYPNSRLQVAGRQQPLFATGAGALAWLDEVVGTPQAASPLPADDWTTFRGNAARNAHNAGGQPLLTPRWRVRMANYPVVEAVIRKMRQAYTTHAVVALPAAHPLAIDDVVVVRTARSLVAVDFRTGKRLWEVGPDPGDPFNQLIHGARSPGRPNNALQLGLSLQHRMWNDTAYGTLSADTERVYAVDGLGFVTGLSGRQLIVMRMAQRRELASQPQTTPARLRALDIRDSGRTVWELGGPNSVEPELSEAFPLGAPLVHSGRLFALAELRSGIRLLVLDARTGRLEWSQQLVDVQHNVQQDPLRRLAGATPSLADGILVCPTSAGAVVAVDLTRRSLLWAYQYALESGGGVSRQQRILRGWRQSHATSSDRWADPTVTLADGRALLTPVKSAELHCLNLIDGQLLWKIPRGENLLVACVHDGKVVLADPGGLTAVSLADGAPAWQQPATLPAGSQPSGRGYLSGDYYYLPLSSAEVAQIDLKEGRIVARAASRAGRVPGNLICHRDRVIAQGSDYLEAFFQIQPLRARVDAALAENPQDAEALARKGEIALDEGGLAEAVDCFRRSFAADPDPLTRDLLVQSLLEALRRDFSANRAAVHQLDQLIDQPQQRVELLRYVAAGYQDAGKPLAALAAYLQLIDMPDAQTEMLDVSPSRSVRFDRWIRARLASLRTSVSEDDRTRIDARIAARMDAALNDAPAINQSRWLLACFDGCPGAAALRLKLARRLLADRALVEAEAHLRQLERSDQGAAGRAAGALMAQLLQTAGRADEAGRYYMQLAGRLRNTVCLDGMTGQQIVDALPADDPVQARLGGEPRWPEGRVEVRSGQPQRKATAYRRTLLPIEGDRGPFFDDVTISLDQHGGQSIVGRDGHGAEVFRVPLTAPNSAQRTRLTNPNCCYGAVRDHLLLVSTGRSIMAIDTLSSASPTWQNVLWRRELTHEVPGIGSSVSVRLREIVVPGRPARFRAEDAQGRTLATLGPLLDHGITFQHYDDLICADPRSGEALWVRRGVPPGSALFGDEELLFVVPPGVKGEALEALVFSPLDGALLGKRPVLQGETARQHITFLGRRVLDWIGDADRTELVLEDLWAQKIVWSRQFADGSRPWLIDDAIGVLEPTGRFVLLSLANGQPLIDAELEPVPDLVAIYLMGSRDQILLIASRPLEGQKDLGTSPLPGASGQTVVSGRIHAFDRRTGKLQWPEPARVRRRGLWLSQPAELPVVVFAQQLVRRDANGRRRGSLSVLCLDRRTGSPVYEDADLPRSTSGLDLVGQPAQRSVTLTAATRQVTMTFSDEPVPPEGPFQDDLARGSGRGPVKGLLRILGTTARAIADAAGDLDEGDPFGDGQPDDDQGQDAGAKGNDNDDDD